MYPIFYLSFPLSSFYSRIKNNFLDFYLLFQFISASKFATCTFIQELIHYFCNQTFPYGFLMAAFGQIRKGLVTPERPFEIYSTNVLYASKASRISSQEIQNFCVSSFFVLFYSGGSSLPSKRALQSSARLPPRRANFPALFKTPFQCALMKKSEPPSAKGRRRASSRAALYPLGLRPRSKNCRLERVATATPKNARILKNISKTQMAHPFVTSLDCVLTDECAIKKHNPKNAGYKNNVSIISKDYKVGTYLGIINQ